MSSAVRLRADTKKVPKILWFNFILNEFAYQKDSQCGAAQYLCRNTGPVTLTNYLHNTLAEWEVSFACIRQAVSHCVVRTVKWQVWKAVRYTAVVGMYCVCRCVLACCRSLKTNMKTVICGNKMPTRCNIGFYCRSYCLLNMFRAPLCPSSGAQEYYTVVAACGISCCKNLKNNFVSFCGIWNIFTFLQHEIPHAATTV